MYSIYVTCTLTELNCITEISNSLRLKETWHYFQKYLFAKEAATRRKRLRLAERRTCTRAPYSRFSLNVIIRRSVNQPFCLYLASKMKWEIKTKEFWRSIFAEYLATLLFLLNCSVTLTFSAQPTITQISLGFGLSIAILVQIFGPASGAHINPAVTVGHIFSRRIKIIRAIFYIIFQIAGGKSHNFHIC